LLKILTNGNWSVHKVNTYWFLGFIEVMEDQYLPDYITQNYEVFDRFTFDYIFRRLLADGYNHENAMDTILHNCVLSALVMQERIYNRYYFEICVSQTVSPDLAGLQRDIFSKALTNSN